MAIDINSFGEKYALAFETIQAGDGRIRLAIANGEPPFEDSREYNMISGHPLLCPLDSGEWALVTSKGAARFAAGSGADAVNRAKEILSR